MHKGPLQKLGYLGVMSKRSVFRVQLMLLVLVVLIFGVIVTIINVYQLSLIQSEGYIRVPPEGRVESYNNRPVVWINGKRVSLWQLCISKYRFINCSMSVMKNKLLICQCMMGNDYQYIYREIIVYYFVIIHKKTNTWERALIAEWHCLNKEFKCTHTHTHTQTHAQKPFLC